MRTRLPSAHLSPSLGAAARAGRNLGAAGAWLVLSTSANGIWLSVRTGLYEFRVLAPAEVLESGEVAVLAKHASDILDGVPGQDLELFTADDQLHVRGHSVDAHVPLRSNAPVARSPVKAKASVILDAFELRSALIDALSATAKDDSRPTQTGVLLEGRGEGLVVCGCDMRRVVERRISVPVPESTSTIIPAPSCDELAREIDRTDSLQNVEIMFGGAAVQFTTGTTTIHSSIIEGRFVDYEPLFAKPRPTRVAVLGSRLHDALAAPLAVAQESDRVLVLEVHSDRLTLSAASRDVGDVAVDCPADITGPPIRTAVIGQFLREVGQPRDSEFVLELSSPLDPLVVVRRETPGHRAAIMPMRVSGTND